MYLLELKPLRFERLEGPVLEKLPEFSFICSWRILERCFCEDGRKIRYAAVISVAAPAVVPQMSECGIETRNTSSITLAPTTVLSRVVKRIQVDVMQDIEKMCLALDKNLLGRAGEERSSAAVPLVEIPCISAHLAQEEFYAILDSRGEEQMEMVRHQLPPVDIYQSLPHVGRLTSNMRVEVRSNRMARYAGKLLRWRSIVEFV